MGTASVAGTTYHVNDRELRKWDTIKHGKLKKIDEDKVYIVDGRERTGKSVYSIQQAAYIDPDIIEDQRDGKILPRIDMGAAKSWEDKSPWRTQTEKRYREGTLLPQITFGAKETLNAIRFYKSSKDKTKALQFDEAFRGMSSTGALSKENRRLTQAMMEMGQSNLVLFIVSPSFYLLSLYPAMLRSNALFHISKDKKSKKRVVRIFNYKRKALLYQIGLKKGWGYPIKTPLNANFYNVYPGGKDFEWRYRLKKQLSLRDSEAEEVKEEHKWKVQRDKIVEGIYSELKSQAKVSEKLKGWGVELSQKAVSNILHGNKGNKMENMED